MTTPTGENEFTDLAADVVRGIQEEAARQIRDGFVPTIEEAPEEVHPQLALFKKIEFSWREEDKNAIKQLRAAAESVFESLFSGSIAALDRFYSSIRVYDPDRPGRFQRTETGAYVEDWSQLSGQDLIKAIFDLQREKVYISQQLSNLFLEASFAKQVSTDVYYEAYRKLMEGTVGDRTAYANQQSKVDRYAAFFRYWIWHSASAFQKEIDGTVRVLEKMADWSTRRNSLQ
ncbi:MAG TPA: hypothetical protein VIY48_15120 [Candidatus Paceibacterota bacterium]